jgi:hypothetical protein
MTNGSRRSEIEYHVVCELEYSIPVSFAAAITFGAESLRVLLELVENRDPWQSADFEPRPKGAGWHAFFNKFLG